MIELQKRRFYEDLTAKYWNSSLKGDCENSDDSEGITLESLGGVFIATIFGLCEFQFLFHFQASNFVLSILDIQVIAMLVLIFEVYYYKRKTKKEKQTTNFISSSPPAYVTTVKPFESYEHTKSVLKSNNILLGHGDNFIPVSVKKSRLSFGTGE